MSTDDKKQEAMELVSKAYQHHMRGEVDRAIELYTKSLDLHRTPEAYTYRGWARSFQKDFDAAIADCHRAIDLDPEYGNPYNDIGAYYLELGQYEDTIPWLHMALKAKRYESYCYPHYNLGRVYEALDKLEQALDHYRSAVQENPGYALAVKAVERVKEKLASLHAPLHGAR
ncbi:tetratricopeptide repeat protein [Geothrix sp. 21YS21S-2]|uniref:tetratricopeptide repeat protein n=1 Tax=Geothrix sp. 21YS21S-2 TaxID=3068893 RepID=UPI0027BAA63C|nr:tetratricopeptide repeat protein [Geothrix sp. 21YS21S-2]